MHRLFKIGLLTLILTMLTSTLTMVPVTSSPTNGPVLAKLYNKVIRSPDAQYTAIKDRALDIMSPVVSPDIVEKAYADGKTVIARPMFQKYRWTYNYGNGTPPIYPNRRIPVCDVNFRHALDHLLPTSYVLGTIFRFIYDVCDTVCPKAFGEWYNPDAVTHPYSPAEAIRILRAAGYIPVKAGLEVPSGQEGTADNWAMPYDLNLGSPDGTPGTTWTGSAWSLTDANDVVPPIEVLTTPNSVSPTEFLTGGAWVSEINAIGLKSLVRTEMMSSTKLAKSKVWDYYIAWHINEYDEKPANDLFYIRYHGRACVPGGFNVHQLKFPAADAQMDIIMSNPDSAAQITASYKLQGYLMGGSPEVGYMPEPSAANGWLRSSTLSPVWYWSIPEALVGSRVSYVIAQPEIKDMVNMLGTGGSNSLSRFHMYWTTADGYRVPGPPGTPTGSTSIWLIRDYPEPLNPALRTSTYASLYAGILYGDLITTNPYTRQDEPGIALDWGYTLMTIGGVSGVKYWYKIKPGVTWADGYAFTAEDVVFGWQFMLMWQIPKWYKPNKYDLVDHVAVETTGPAGPGDYACLYLKTVDIWKAATYAGHSIYFPPQIWDRNWGSTSAMLAYRPEFDTYGPDNMGTGWMTGQGPYTTGPLYGTADCPTTNLFGTGMWTLTTIDSNYGWAEYIANRNYYRSQTDMKDKLKYQFWRVGDTTENGAINIDDLARIGRAFATEPGMANWDVKADCTSAKFGPPDLVVDFVDLTVCGLYSGEYRTVPP